MKIRRLTRKSGETVVSVWPPQWAFSHRPGDTLALGEEGVLASVLLSGERLVLTMKDKGREYTGSLQWDAPPPLVAVEKVLHANLGKLITTIADLDVAPLNLRTRAE